MIFLGNLTPINSTKSQVGFNHNMPFDQINGMGMTQEQLEAKGILVDSVPEPQPPTGQIVSGMFVDPTSKTVFYEYAEAPKTQEQQIADLKTQLQTTQDAVDFLLMGGM